VAQVSVRTSYDSLWGDQKELSLKLLRLAADAYAAHRLELPRGIVLRAILRPLSSTYSADLPIDEWNNVNCSVPKILTWLNPHTTPALITETAEQLDIIFSTAIQQWTETGYPEDPRTDDLLENFLEILFRAKFIKHPPHEGTPRFEILTPPPPRDILSTSPPPSRPAKTPNTPSPTTPNPSPPKP
jgi:hypothetical protein